MLVKGALFLTVVVAAADFRRGPGKLILAAALALSLAGLPFTGGALAKLALKAQFGYGPAASLASASAAGTALLMLHFLTRLGLEFPGDGRAWQTIGRHWPAVALVAIFLPWLVYPVVGDVSEAVTLGKLWDGLWPIIIGGGLAVALQRWGKALPRVPEGDTVVAAEAAFKASFGLSALFESVDARLRQWPIGGLSLLAIALVLAAMAARGG